MRWSAWPTVMYIMNMNMSVCAARASRARACREFERREVKERFGEEGERKTLRNN